MQAEFDGAVDDIEPADEAYTEEADEADSDETPPEWADQEPVEEVVMATGEFGAEEISSSLQEEGSERTYTDPDWDPEEWQPEQATPDADSGSRKAIWLAGLTVLAVAFAGQLLHYNRDSLAASNAYGANVRSVYALLGTELYPDWPIDGYEIRGSEAVAGENGQDVLDIRAQVASVSDTTIGLPQLRVILRDRWSNPVAARTFTPAEYGDRTNLPASGMLEPGQSIAAHVAIADPGSGAQGFEVEICLPRRDTGLQCAGQSL